MTPSCQSRGRWERCGGSTGRAGRCNDDGISSSACGWTEEPVPTCACEYLFSRARSRVDHASSLIMRTFCDRDVRRHAASAQSGKWTRSKRTWQSSGYGSLSSLPAARLPWRRTSSSWTGPLCATCVSRTDWTRLGARRTVKKRSASKNQGGAAA